MPKPGVNTPVYIYLHGGKISNIRTLQFVKRIASLVKKSYIAIVARHNKIILLVVKIKTNTIKNYDAIVALNDLSKSTSLFFQKDKSLGCRCRP